MKAFFIDGLVFNIARLLKSSIRVRNISVGFGSGLGFSFLWRLFDEVGLSLLKICNLGIHSCLFFWVLVLYLTYVILDNSILDMVL